MSGKAEETVEKSYTLQKDFAGVVESEAQASGRSEEEVLRDWFFDNDVWLVSTDVEESIVSLRFIDTKGDVTLDEVGEDGDETAANLKIYRKLREEFGPVTAGIDYLKAFVAGSGATVGIDDVNDPHQVATKDEINRLNENIFMDEMTKGLDTITDILLDEAYVEGVSAGEIVYKKFKDPGSFDFSEYASKEEFRTQENDKNVTKVRYRPKELEDKDWKDLGGVVQLKVVESAYTRLKPYRDPKTYQILYWTVDEKKTVDWNNQNRDKKKKEVVKLLPWQVLWVNLNRRGPKLKGVSWIKPVAAFALLLQKILKDIGISTDKWADRKYFFVLGSDKTGRSWAPPHIRNFIANVKKMAEKGGVGVPVPQGFDIKSIGGEVYDGGQILDKLLSMITSGMKYPRTFIEQGKTQEGDKAWLAWIVTYGKQQTLLRRIIEHQLWARHLNCVFGTEYEVKKQGVKEEDREKRPTYVPKMQWRSEGKWHRETKLEMLTGILNVANPVGPEAKLAIEEDIMKTLGYSEVDLKTARELLKTNQEIEVLDRDIELLNKEMELELLQKAKEENLHLEMEPKFKFGAPEEEEEPEEEPKEPRPKPEPGKQLKGGVSRTPKETGGENEKGKAKPLKKTRTPPKR